MGEEYGEPAPFQFFSDHVDEKIARATREGRRREFAQFAHFDEQIPDPQDPGTFERSKLTRRRDEATARLYAELLRVRSELPPVDGVEFDPDARWLRVRRGEFELVCNFGTASVRLPCGGDQLVLATDADTSLEEGAVYLEPLSGALVR